MIQRFARWRSLFLIIATAIVAGTIYYTRYLARKIEKRRTPGVEEWVHAINVIQQSN
jgi:hypothetical protein